MALGRMYRKTSNTSRVSIRSRVSNTSRGSRSLVPTEAEGLYWKFTVYSAKAADVARIVTIKQTYILLPCGVSFATLILT